MYKKVTPWQILLDLLETEINNEELWFCVLATTKLKSCDLVNPNKEQILAIFDALWNCRNGTSDKSQLCDIDWNN